MIWLVIVVIMIAAFGPVLWLMPSARERRLAALRQRAYKEGLRVDLRRLPGSDVAAEDRVTAGGKTLDTSREVAAYVAPLGARLKMLPNWRLLRGEAGTRALPGWSFEAGKRPEHAELATLLETLRPLIADLPDDVVALECESHALAGYWLESPGAKPDRVTELARQLTAAGHALSELDARLLAATEPGNI